MWPGLSRLGPAAWAYLLHNALIGFALAVGGLIFNLAALAFGYSAIRVSLPWLGDLELLGLLTSAPVAAGALLGLPLWGVVIWRGPRWALAGSALLIAAGMALLAAAPPWPIALLAALLSGPAGVLYAAAAAPLMMQLSEPANRDLLFSLSAGSRIIVVGIGNLLAGLLTDAIAPLVGAGAPAYQAIFGLAALLAVLALLPLRALRALPPMARPAQAVVRPRWAWRAWLQQGYAIGRQLLPLSRFALPPLLISCGAALLIPYLNLFFRSRFPLSDSALGAIFAAIALATGAATLLAPLLVRRFGRIGTVLLCQSLAIGALLVLGSAPLLSMAIGAALLRGALMNMATPLYEAHALEASPPELHTLMIGMIRGSFTAAYLVMPVISVAVQREQGFAPLIAATASCYAFAVLLTALVAWPRTPPQPLAR